jgi:hypothetical protein
MINDQAPMTDLNTPMIYTHGFDYSAFLCDLCVLCG